MLYNRECRRLTQVENRWSKQSQLDFPTSVSRRLTRSYEAPELTLRFKTTDTAQVYGNETEVGQGIRESGLDRKDIWLTTKWYVGPRSLLGDVADWS